MVMFEKENERWKSACCVEVGSLVKRTDGLDAGIRNCGVPNSYARTKHVAQKTLKNDRRTVPLRRPQEDRKHKMVSLQWQNCLST